ncbi:MAG: DEAD/DEAH box helicase [Actinobacteria bacterium]|nr:DEAD/DEAH box helicase [Actinomycetota bacterium]
MSLTTDVSVATAPFAAITEVLSRHTGDVPPVHVEVLPPVAARTAALARPLPPVVADRVPVAELWTHQARAVDLVRSGRSVAVATGTASGKSLCYQLPIAESVTDPVRPGTALCVFPTKALAQDQLRGLGALGVPGLVAATYDGDTGREDRSWARRHANVILTNPEMLHCGLLPHHDRWATFLMRLRFVVLDELHTLRGIFGTHVAHVLRRLRRLCHRYGSSPTFVFTSATIGEPARLASALCGLPVTAVVDDGSPRGERRVALWNPPLLDASTGSRVPAHRLTAGLVADLVEEGHRTIAFCRSRRGTEIVAADVQRRLPPHLARAVRPYRGGYLPSERREIEAELFGGRLRAVVATTALELGVDVGGLDACVLDGFPGTIASFWQQAGRAGRERQTSLAVLVAGEDALDQYLCAHPTELFSRPPEPAVVNPSNPQVLDLHLACAAYESPLTPDDARWWGDDLDDSVRRLVQADRLKVRRWAGRAGGPPPVKAVWAGRGVPSHGVGLRSGSPREYRIATRDGSLVGTVDETRAFDLVHPGAVYLHQGRAYRVVELDIDDRTALVEPSSGDDYTVARSTTDIRLLGVDDRRAVGAATLHLGPVRVTTTVTGYQRKDVRTRAVLGAESLELPASTLTTRAFWYTVPPGVLTGAGVAVEDWPGTLHAVEHAAIGILPLFTICDRWDVGGVSTAWSDDAGAPTIVVYDGYPGGAGIAELGFDAADRHLAATLEVLARCPCASGCPSCVQSPKCGNLNEPLDKAGATRLLRAVVAGASPSGGRPSPGDRRIRRR